MACTPQELVTDARCLVQAMGERQLLASIAFSLATLAGSSTDPEDLVAESKCLWESLGERQLLAIIAYQQCLLNGG